MGKGVNYEDVKRLCVFDFAGWPEFHCNKGNLSPETSCPGLFLFPVTQAVEKLFAVNSVLFSTNESFCSLIESTLSNKHVRTFQVSTQLVEAETGHETPLICMFAS